MGRAPCCDKANVKRGPWSPEEDAKLKEYIEKNGTGGNWIALPKKVDLKRCGKSCRLRWLNYLRPNIKHGEFSDAEDKIICSLFASIGSRWSIIASQLPGRTDNDIKNYWNTKLKKKMMIAMNHSAERRPQQVTFLSILQNSTPSSSNSIFQAQESFIHPTQKFQFKASSSSNFVFGETTSCSSSSDGSCNNKISHVTGPKLGYSEGGVGSTFVEQIGGVDYLYNGVEDNYNLMFTNAGNVSGWTEKQNGLWGENPLEYGVDEIKQLISTGSCNNFLLGDEKTEEKVMY